MNRLAGKVVALMGGASGIGEGIARRLASEGAAVAIGDIDGAQADSLAREIGNAFAYEVDMASDEGVRTFVEACTRRFGGLDAFHANAANFGLPGDDSDAVSIHLDVYDRIISVNMRGCLLGAKYAVPALLARGGGTVLFTSSAAAHSASQERVAYGMSKAALGALVRHVAARWGRDGVRANAIAPGLIETFKLQPRLEGGLGEWGLRQQALRTRLGRPADIAAMAAHLISDDGAFITGQIISVDAGMTMRP